MLDSNHTFNFPRASFFKLIYCRKSRRLLESVNISHLNKTIKQRGDFFIVHPIGLLIFYARIILKLKMDCNTFYNVIKKLSHLFPYATSILLHDFPFICSFSGGYVLMKFDTLDASSSFLHVGLPIAQMFLKSNNSHNQLSQLYLYFYLSLLSFLSSFFRPLPLF